MVRYHTLTLQVRQWIQRRTTELKTVQYINRSPRLCTQASSSSGLDPAQQKLRERFWIQEREFEASVCYDQLTEDERRIHQAHGEAVKRGHFTYDDPLTGERQLTRLRHFLKGKCCGSACRHCIYDHVKVPEAKKKTRRFNTAFWVYDQEVEEDDQLMKDLYGL